MPPKARTKNSSTAALFVRLPLEEAEKLDRAAFELRASKQDLVTGLVARYVDPSSQLGLAELRELSLHSRSGRLAREGFGFGDRRRITVETEGDTVAVGRHTFLPAEAADVLTLEEAGRLLQVEEDTARTLAETHELPGRRLGGEWRFARQAILDWLAAGRAEDDEGA